MLLDNSHISNVVMTITMLFSTILNKGYAESNSPIAMFKIRNKMPIYKIVFFMAY